jgi:hypothetical protein
LSSATVWPSPRVTRAALLAVRRLVGHDRYSSRAAFTTLPRLYGLLRLQLNFFRPVRTFLLSKRRVGAKLVKRSPL